MKIGIIGSGRIGATLARLWSQAGHDIAISNSRGPESLGALVREMGPGVRAASAADAAAFGDVVLVAIPMGRYRSLPADALAGKIIIDAMNYYSQRDGVIDFAGRTSSEHLAHFLPGSRVVKAFNTMHFMPLGSEGRKDAPLDDRLAIFMAGDDPDAKATVARLIEDIGFAPIDTGSLATSTRQEPGAPVYAKTITAWEARRILAASS